MNTTIAIPESPEQLQRELRELEYRQMGLRPLPNIQVARDALTDAQARHSTNEKYLFQLQAAQKVLAERLAQHDQFAALGKEIAAMQERLVVAESRQRAERIAIADRRLAAAKAEYEQAQVACARAFRSLIEQNARSSSVQGADIARIDYSLHLPSLTPLSWSGTTGEVMSSTTLPFERPASIER